MNINVSQLLCQEGMHQYVSCPFEGMHQYVSCPLVELSLLLVVALTFAAKYHDEML